MPGSPQSAIFLPQRKMKIRATASNPPAGPLPIGIARAALEDLAGILARQLGLDFDTWAPGSRQARS
jgi:hypothetical protein